MTQPKITCRFRHHQLGIDVEARVNDGDWQPIELVPARQFATPGDQQHWPALFMRALRAKGYDVCWIPAN